MDVERMLAKASEEAGRRNFDYAVRLYREILGLKPDLVEARRGLRETELKKLARRPPSRVQVIVTSLVPRVSVAVLQATKRYPSLLGACERYLERDPKNLRVNTILGDAAARLGMVDTAIYVFESLAEMHPEEVEGLKRLGDLYHRKGEIDRSLDAYERALALRPHDPEAQKARKDLAAEGAIRSTGLDRAQSSRELVRDREALRRIEASQRMVHAPDEIAAAIAQTEAELKEKPDDVLRLRQLADLFAKKGDVGEAVEVLAEALEIEPDSEEVRSRYGDLKIRSLGQQLAEARTSGDPDRIARAEAEDRSFRAEEYGRRVRLYPTDMRVRFLFATALLDEGRVDEAIAGFQHTIRDPKHRLDSLVRLGDCFSRKKMYDLASKQLLEALEAASGNAERELEILYTLGTVYEALGDAERARQAFSRVYEKNIRYRDVAQKMGALGQGPGSPS